MKLIFIMAIIFSPSVHSAFMSKVHALNCNSSKRVVYTRLFTCTRNHSDCIKIPKGYICETHAEVDGKIAEDSGKKASWDVAKSLEVSNKAARKSDGDTLRGLVSSIRGGSSLTPAQRRKFDLLLIRMLRE